MDYFNDVVGFRYPAIDSVIDSVDGGKSLIRSLIRCLPTLKMGNFTLSKSLIRRANKHLLQTTESMANFKVFYSPCSEI
jgi:hypothetical protein